MKQTMPVHKYRPFEGLKMESRTWPDAVIKAAPAWCSVDLRDGNQALVDPMDLPKKWEMFSLLVELGFREIEVGFPSASETDYEFVRFLIEGGRLPEDVTIQVLTPARPELIRRTVTALEGVGRAVIHLYNSTSRLQRRVVFRKGKDQIKDLAVLGAKVIREEARRLAGSDILFEYSPESFMATEPDFAVAICEAVAEVWEPSPDRRVILNLPLTVEMATPNVYADQIEWFCGHIRDRESYIISVHAHNDRGTAVAATELALMAGAERVEGTLFGNGERTGNVDIVTLALNLYTQGIDPGIDLSDIDRIVAVSKRCTAIPVHVRHPYAGELVYTAFSGSHQDAISKGMKALVDENNPLWEVPYLPIDPADVGRTYESIIRINSQSGKAGAAYIMDREFGFQLPKEMHPDFGAAVQRLSEELGREVLPGEIRKVFEETYVNSNGPIELRRVRTLRGDGSLGAVRSAVVVEGEVSIMGNVRPISGRGNGPIDAFCNSLMDICGCRFRLAAYHEHAIERGSGARAAAYIRVEDDHGGVFWGVGIDPDIEIASCKAVVVAVNRMIG